MQEMALPADNPGVVTFSITPNELKLIIADKLPIADVNSLGRTSSAVNNLLTQYIYRRAADERSSRGVLFFERALEHGSVTAIRRFVELGVDINRSDLGTTWAGILDEVQVDEYWHHGSSIFLQSFSPGYTPLQIALRAHGRDEQEPIVRLLLDAGANIHPCWSEFRSALVSSVWSGSTEFAQLVLDQDIYPKIIDGIGGALLYYAVIRRHPAIVELLLGAGVDVNASLNCGWTALHWAARHGFGDVVETLLDWGANVAATDTGGNSALLVAVHYRGTRTAAHTLLDRAGPYQRALRRARINAVRAGESIAGEQIQLFPGARDNLIQSFNSARPNDQTIDLLLDAGADIWAENKQNYSPIVWAVYCTTYANTSVFIDTESLP